jgi:hypothetical protein
MSSQQKGRGISARPSGKLSISIALKPVPVLVTLALQSLMLVSIMHFVKMHQCKNANFEAEQFHCRYKDCSKKYHRFCSMAFISKNSLALLPEDKFCCGCESMRRLDGMLMVLMSLIKSPIPFLFYWIGGHWKEITQNTGEERTRMVKQKNHVGKVIPSIVHWLKCYKGG